MEEKKTQEKRLFRPDNNIVQISGRKDHKHYLFLTKIYLKSLAENQTDVELHAMGIACTNAVRVAEILASQGYATIKKINSFTFKSKEEGDDRERSKIKLVVTLTKTKEFEEMTKTLKVKSD